MPEPLKNLYTKELISSVSLSISKIDPSFDKDKFNKDIFNGEWPQKELKERMHHIAVTLREHLPSEYKKAVKILIKVSPQYEGFQYMFFPEFISLYGLEDFNTSIKALKAFTPYASSEFAIRPFIQKYPKESLDVLINWAKDKNHHVRRLASEGSRPRLPWAMSLPQFIDNPKPILKILNLLKNDSSEYVRRSVANSLNDISKDNPNITIQIAQKWLGKNENRNKLIKHACRSLLKQAQPDVLKLFSYTPIKNLKIIDFKCEQRVKMGERLKFSFQINSTAILGLIRVEYAIGFLKKNNQHSYKVFKLSERHSEQKLANFNKELHFKPITTRKYYEGKHKLRIIINGQGVQECEFILKL